jgi:hypothetical protein
LNRELALLVVSSVGQRRVEVVEQGGPVKQQSVLFELLQRE